MAKSKRSLSVDLSDVDVDGPGRVSEGDHKVKVLEVTEEEGAESGKPYLNWKLKVIKGAEDDDKGKTLYHITSLQAQALFNLRKTLEAAGIEIPNKAMNLDLDELEGLTFMVTTEDEEYKGKKRSRVIDTYSEDGGSEEAEADEKPAKSKKKDAEEEADEKPAKGKKGKDAEEEDDSKSKKKPASKKSKSFSEGELVTFDNDGDEMTGKVVSIDEDEAKATVKVKGEEWEVDFADLTSAE